MSAGVPSPWNGGESCSCVNCARWAFFGVEVTSNLAVFLEDHRSPQARKTRSRAARDQENEALRLFNEELGETFVPAGTPTAPELAARWLDNKLSTIVSSALSATLRSEAARLERVDLPPASLSPPASELRAPMLSAAPGAPNGARAAAA